MRAENEMYDLILDIAKNDVRIKAVYMNGSRTNENVPKDIFQDYDIVYVTDDTKSFIEDKDWIRLFGEILYMQYPDENPYYPSDKENSYGWLMQFADGTRIDLTVQSINYALNHIQDDKLCRILLDKENILPEIAEATDCQYWVKKPTKEQYSKGLMAEGESLCTGYGKSCCKRSAYYYVKLEGWYLNRMVSKHRKIIKILISVDFRKRMENAFINLF